jgi:FlaA1/EpsC-like NDP-sugar epimerase
MRNRYLFVADILAIVLAAWMAFGLRWGWLFFGFRHEFIPFLLAAVVVKLSIFYGFGLYRRFWRYAAFWDLVAIVLANSAASVLLTAIMVGVRFMGLIDGWSRMLTPLDWLFCLSATLGLRVSVRAIAETKALRHLKPTKLSRNVLVVGAGDAGALVAREMQKNPQLSLRPIGFLDDAREKVGHQIHGLPILGGIAALADVAAAHQVDEVVIAIPTAGGDVLRAAAERCQAAGLPSRVVPGLYELLDGNVSVSRLRSIEISDLLRRPQVKTDAGGSAYIQGASVVITGAGGSIGSELCRQVAFARPRRLMLLGHGENSIYQIAGELRQRFPTVETEIVIADVRDRERILRVFRRAAPTVVFHAAAHKHVPHMEAHAAEAVTNNVVGTRNVVEAAVAVGVERFVMVSTDKAVAPGNMMGASKRLAEQIVQRAGRIHGRAFVVVRFGNVLGSRGSVVPMFKAQIEQGGPVTVTHPEVRRYFMTISEAVHLILQAGGIGLGSELFVLDMGEPVLMRDMAADMIRLSGLEASDIKIVYVGLRPGEKLDEILWEPDAVIEPTARGDIRRVVELTAVTDDRLDDVVERLAAAATADDHDRIVRLFHECLPSAALTPRPRSTTPAATSVVVRLPSA